ncbi:MAG: PKD domain-containing protein [Reichenbachiella sp.]|uniref:PKD domain-containing protein n=1 Tax=Reichenbachiella sp. TaxID=2184521 RepID=UPI003262FCED
MKSLKLVIFGLGLGLFSSIGLLASASDEKAMLATALFTADPVCEGEETIFVNNSSTSAGSIVTTNWDFKDGSGSTLNEPKHVFASSGTFAVSLTVVDANGDFDVYVTNVVVNPKPDVSFVLSSSDQCESTTFDFTNASAIPAPGVIDSYLWDFGDGSTATTEDASHNYASPGTYTVSLTVTPVVADGNICPTTITEEVVVHPEAVVDFSVENVCQGDESVFINNTQVVTGNLTYDWDFGDGNVSTEINPKHTYATEGSYTVRLEATSSAGSCITFIEQTVDVFAEPTAGFSADDECLGDVVSFTNTSAINVGTMTYAWDFGDGSAIDTDTDPTHDYDNAGTYLVSLTATSNLGCTDVYTENINVRPLPVADFSVSDVCDGSAMIFINESSISAGSITFDWDFGDGNNSTDENPSHTYLLPNDYDVTLTVTSGFGCADQIVREVTVFSASDGGSLAGSAVRCEDDTDPYVLTLSGHVGEVNRWESSLTNDEPWATIANQTTTLTYSDLTATTYYRAVVSSGPCAEGYSSVATVQIDALSVGGNITGTATVCTNANSGTLTLQEHTGSVVEWQHSTTSAVAGFSSVANTTTSLNYTDLANTTYYRAVLQNGVCGQVFSEVATITTLDETNAGLLSGATTVCNGSNTGSLTLAGQVGDILHWESSPTGNEPWSSIDNQTSTLDYEDLIATVYYRVVVQNGACDEEISNIVLIEVDENTVVGTISGKSDVCIDASSGTLALEDHLGTVTKWEFSDGSTPWTDIVNTTANHNFSGLTETTTYRAVVQNGVCLELTSPEFIVQVNPLPTIVFSNDEVCEGTKTTFTNLSTISSGSLESSLWDFGNGGLSVDLAPEYTFSEAGTFAVKLTMTSDKGCENDLTQSVVVNAVPTADFIHDDVCLDATTFFTDLSEISIGTIDTYTWDFGDSESSTDASPTHLYAAHGEYTVELLIESDQGCTDELSTEVIVYELPEVDFTFDDLCDGEVAAFTNESTIGDGGMFYSWNFGDGSKSTDSNPQHTYATDGSYSVNLEVESTVGRCLVDFTQTIEVFVKPEVEFTVDNVCFGEEVTLVNSSNIFGETVDYSWDFGDGSSATDEAPTHLYGAVNSYEILLEVNTSNGCSDSYTRSVYISPLPSVNFSADDVCETEHVQFNNLTSISTGTVSYTWDFGDTNTSTETNPEHLYDEKGEYTITLTASTTAGCTEVIDRPVTVYPSPRADFEFDNVCDGNESQFVNISTIDFGTITSYEWDFGDGGNSILQNPSKLYLNAGTYDVLLKVISDGGCQSESTQEVSVYNVPLADFSVEDVCFGETVQIDNSSSIAQGSVTYLWQLGDNTTSVSSNPAHEYELPGTYEIGLTVTSGNGCEDSYDQEVIVHAIPEAYAGLDTVVSKGYTIQLIGSGGYTYSWSPHQTLDNSLIYNPLATPLETTTYELLVTDLYGCQDTDEVVVEVTDDYKIVPTNVMTPDGNGQNDAWTIANIETFGSANVVVFDRWGTVVYEKKGYQNDWYGTAGNDILPDGTYYYVITFDDSQQGYKGAITIIRNR